MRQACSSVVDPFATLGLAEDTWALNEHILDDEQFIQQCLDVDRERGDVLRLPWTRSTAGCACACSTAPTASSTRSGATSTHEHPARRLRKLRRTPANVHRRALSAHGRSGGPDDGQVPATRTALLMIISDHGFNSFRRGVDLNRWLEENGYLKVHEGRRGEEHLAGVDWSQTRAFAVGLAGIFINLKGR